MANYAITGVAGFIGSHLAEKLINLGHHVIGLDNFDPFYARSVKEDNIAKLRESSNFQLYGIDVRGEDFVLALSNTSVDSIIHLSARAGVRPSLMFPQSYIQHDIEATVNILETCKRLGVKNMIFGSSSSVYGNLPDLPYLESLKIDKPISPYAAAKLSCELFNYVYHSQYGINISNLRFFTVYGPRQRPEMGIHKFTRLIDQGKTIQMYGDGSSSRDYTYVDDIVQGILQAIEKVDGYKTYNLGNNKPVKLKKLIETIESKLGKKAKINQIEMQPGDVDHTLADITLAKKELNYHPTTSIERGIEIFIDWYKGKNSK